MSLSWKQLHPFGAEIDIDLGQPLSAEQQRELNELFAEHHLLVAGGQALDREQQNRLTTYFGPLLENDVDMVSNDPAVGMFGSQQLALHSDLSFVPIPVLVGILHALDVQSGTSSTLFASGARAYQQLDPELRARISGLEVLNVFPHDQTRRNRLSSLADDDPRAAHPLVGTDARSGLPYLYLCEMQVDSIVGMDADDGEALIQELLAVMTAADNIYEHVWKPGDCVIWDNLVVQHGRADVAEVGTRTLQRSTAATIGFFEQVPQFGFADDGMVTKVD
ncbi:MAG: taurine dioxygenase [Acidimicrobiales bacterium]|nr:taurine dioxygenase [Acidimicrobiales bacterium]